MKVLPACLTVLLCLGCASADTVAVESRSGSLDLEVVNIGPGDTIQWTTPVSTQSYPGSRG